MKIRLLLRSYFCMSHKSCFVCGNLQICWINNKIIKLIYFCTTFQHKAHLNCPVFSNLLFSMVSVVKNACFEKTSFALYHQKLGKRSSDPLFTNKMISWNISRLLLSWLCTIKKTTFILSLFLGKIGDWWGDNGCRPHLAYFNFSSVPLVFTHTGEYRQIHVWGRFCSWDEGITWA